MTPKVLFADVSFDRYAAASTLPAKFGRLIDRSGLSEKVGGKWTAVKMHLGRNMGYTTVHPIFIKTLTDRLTSYGAKVFVTDQSVSDAQSRGYSPDYFGCPVTDVCGVTGKYFYPREISYKTFKNVDIGGNIHDADFIIDLSHVKGHGACGYGGACKNIAMGCVTDRTRQQIHRLEGGIDWDGALCTHCDACIDGCGHGANSFNDKDEYKIFFHHCTFCQHCVKVCPTGAVKMTDDRYRDFQTGMALCTKEVLSSFDGGCAYFINFLTDITAVCDCWGLSTPSLVPDIGIMAGDDIVAVERACIDAIKHENLLPNSLPVGVELGDKGHLFERIHGKNPYIQLEELERLGLGSHEYEFEEII